MINFLTPAVLSELTERFGNRFTQLDDLDRVILATALIESVVNHARLQEISIKHPSDISRALQQLVKDGLLETSGSGRGMVYCLSGTHFPTPEAPFPQESSFDDTSLINSDGLRVNSDDLRASSDGLGANSDGFKTHSEERSPRPERHQDGRLIITDLADIDSDLHRKLMQATEIPRVKKKLPVEEMEQVILEACQIGYLSLRVLAELLDRSPNPLRQGHLNRMIKDKKLLRAFPMEPNSPKQAYTSAETKIGD